MNMTNKQFDKCSNATGTLLDDFPVKRGVKLNSVFSPHVWICKLSLSTSLLWWRKKITCPCLRKWNTVV